MISAIKTDVGKYRHNNEDAFYLPKKDANLPKLFIVADGMGGHQGGEIASKLAVKEVSEYINKNITKNLSPSQIKTIIMESLFEANNKILKCARENSHWYGMGTTITMALFYGDTLYIGHIGDSRAYRIRDKKITLLTEDHSLVWELMEEVPTGVKEFIPIESARDMYEIVLKKFPLSDIVIKAAAVGDYTPAKTFSHKIKKNDRTFTLELKRNPDILRELGRLKREDQILVGFAAETRNIEANAQRKLEEKNLDLIVVNNVIQKNAGFDSDTNIVTIIEKNGKIEDFPKMTKKKVADIILDKVIDYMN